MKMFYSPNPTYPSFNFITVASAQLPRPVNLSPLPPWNRRIDTTGLSLNIMHQKASWILNGNQFRLPDDDRQRTLLGRQDVKTKIEKADEIAIEISYYRGGTGSVETQKKKRTIYYLFHTIFKLPVDNYVAFGSPSPSETNKMFVPDKYLTQLRPMHIFLPNKYSYPVPEGTFHWVMWYNYFPGMFGLDEASITKHIDEELTLLEGKDRYEFVWYENPNGTLNYVYHVQVFWHKIDTPSPSTKLVQPKITSVNAIEIKQENCKIIY
jgi:hypothetical protein